MSGCSMIDPLLCTLPGPHGPSISGTEFSTPEYLGETTTAPAAQGDLK